VGIGRGTKPAGVSNLQRHDRDIGMLQDIVFGNAEGFVGYSPRLVFLTRVESGNIQHGRFNFNTGSICR
jgi:hypothetical protein